MKLQTSIPPRRDGTVRHTAKDGKTYLFTPGPDGDLVCDVEDPEVLAFLLKSDNFYPVNPEDYDKALQIAGKPQSPVIGPAGGKQEANGVLIGSDSFDAILNVGGKDVQLGDVVARAFAASGMSADEWNALGAEDRDDLIEAELDRMEAATEDAPGGLPVEANTPPAPKAAGGKGGKGKAK